MMRIAKAGTVGTALLGLAWAGLAAGCSKDVRTEELAVVAPEGVRTFAVDVENFRGDVTIRVNPAAKGPDVDSSLRAGSETHNDQQKDIASAVAVTAVVEDRTGVPTLVVRSVSQRGGTDHFTNIDIELPGCDGVRVKTGGGEVVVVGARGAMTIDNGDGPIEIRTNQPLTAPMLLTARNGSVYYQAPLTSTGQFDAKTEDGKVMWRASEPSALSTPVRIGGKTMTATLNQGTNPVAIHTDNGDITVLLMEDAQSRIRTTR